MSPLTFFTFISTIGSKTFYPSTKLHFRPHFNGPRHRTAEKLVHAACDRIAGFHPKLFFSQRDAPLDSADWRKSQGGPLTVSLPYSHRHSAVPSQALIQVKLFFSHWNFVALTTTFDFHSLSVVDPVVPSWSQHTSVPPIV